MHNSLFVGLAPANAARNRVVVIVNEPRGDEHLGGQVAAPVFSGIAAGAMRILNVPPDDAPRPEPAKRIAVQTGAEGLPEL